MSGLTEKHPTQGSVSYWREIGTSWRLGLSPGVVDLITAVFNFCVPVTLQSFGSCRMQNKNSDKTADSDSGMGVQLHTRITLMYSKDRLVSDGFLAKPDSSDFGTKFMEFKQTIFWKPSMSLGCHTLSNRWEAGWLPSRSRSLWRSPTRMCVWGR